MTETLFSLNTLVAVVDILIVAVVIYLVILMFKGTRAERMFWGLGVVVLVYFVSQRTELLTLHWLLSNFLGSIVIFIIVVFQQDIRRALVQMGKPFSYRETTKSQGMLEELAKAAGMMSGSRTGGIIAIERGIDVDDFLDAGVDIDAEVSKELILSLFNVASPLHDGAVVVRGGRLYKAGCILPLTDRADLDKSMGTRHRAAMGLAEETDAVIIVVSEQTGEMTLVVEDELYVGIDRDSVLMQLKNRFSSENHLKRNIFPWKVKV